MTKFRLVQILLVAAMSAAVVAIGGLFRPQVQAIDYDGDCEGNDLCELALDMFDGNDGCNAEIGGDDFIPYCFHYRVNDLTYYCSISDDRTYTDFTLANILGELNVTQETELCENVFANNGEGFNNFDELGLQQFAGLQDGASEPTEPGTPPGPPPSCDEAFIGQVVTEGSNELQVFVSGCAGDYRGPIPFTYRIGWRDEEGTREDAGLALQTNDNGTFSGSFRITADRVAYANTVTVFAEESAIGRIVLEIDAFNEEPEPTNPDDDPYEYGYNSPQYGIANCPYGNLIVGTDGVTITPGAVTDEEFAEFDRCAACIAGGGLWTGFGCIVTSIQGIFNAILRITLGVMGGVALIRLIFLGYQYQFAGEDKIKPTIQDILATLGGLLLVLFSVVLLRFIGVNLLDIVPEGFF